MSDAVAWTALAGLGAFHGINPAMGWLFAVAIGLQRQSRAALLRSLLPIAAGHALSIAVVITAVLILRTAVDLGVLRVAAALLLFAFGLYRLVARHRQRGGMQVGVRDLTLWSFLTATGHGAGLMLLPFLLQLPIGADSGGHVHAGITGFGHSTVTSIGAVALHTLTMLAVATVIATLVYDWLGLAFLRRGWINLDLLWALALVVAGAILLLGGAIALV